MPLPPVNYDKLRRAIERALPKATHDQHMTLLVCALAAREQAAPWATPVERKEQARRVAECSAELLALLERQQIDVWEAFAPASKRTQADIEDMARLRRELGKLHRAADAAAAAIVVRPGTRRGGPALGVMLELVIGWRDAFGEYPPVSRNGDFTKFYRATLKALGIPALDDPYRTIRDATAIAASANIPE